MKDKFQILRDFANSNNKPDKTIYQFIKEVLDMNSAYAKENKQLKMINKEYERLNKENARSFKITNVQEYDIYELLSFKNYKDNWNKLKEYIRKNIIYDDVGMKILDPSPLEEYMQELEGSDRNDKK